MYVFLYNGHTRLNTALVTINSIRVLLVKYKLTVDNHVVY